MMEKNNKAFDYLYDNLTEAERQAFEEELIHDKALREEVDLHKNIDMLVAKKARHDEVVHEVKQLHRLFLAEKTNAGKKRKLITYWSVAASVILLAGITALIYFSQPDYDRLYQEQFTSWMPQQMLRGDSQEVQLQQWTEAYQNSDFKTVVEQFDQLPMSFTSEPVYQVMYACALMEEHNYALALGALAAVNASESTIIQSNVYWYTGLCELKLENITGARESFRILTTYTNAYKERAEEILEQLE